MPNNLIENRIGKATRIADGMQGGHAASAVLADVDGWTREDWNDAAEFLGEKAPSDETVRLVISILEDRAKAEAPGFDPFEGVN